MQRFPYGKTFMVGFGFFGISVIWPLFNSLIPPMLEDLGLSAVVIGFILTWDNILNMFLQPWVGERSDRTRTRLGRRKPWLILGAPIAAVFFIIVPFVRSNVLWIALAILGTNVGMALFRSPTIAYLGDLFRPEDRSKANGVINLMGGLGGAVALFGGGALYRLGVPLPFIVGSAVLLAAVLLVVVAVKEPPLPLEQDSTKLTAVENKKPGLWLTLKELFTNSDRSGMYLLLAIFSWFIGWNAMEAFFTIYARNVLGIDEGTGTQMLTAFAAALILFAIPSGIIATRFGRKPTIITGLVGMTVGLLVGFFISQQIVLLILLAGMGVFWALININSLPMVYDLGGGENIGALTGLYYFASSAAAITGPIVGGVVIDLINHRSLFLFSAAAMLLAMVCMSRIHLAGKQ
ncbi:MAG: SLC45 family MFS transporter [Anaerolineales bacterium]|nr:SLC45 family MFS transporter [Anaerolineales bacterium]